MKIFNALRKRITASAQPCQSASSLPRHSLRMLLCLESSMDRGAWGPWGHKELDTTEQPTVSLSSSCIIQFVITVSGK